MGNVEAEPEWSDLENTRAVAQAPHSVTSFPVKSEFEIASFPCPGHQQLRRRARGSSPNPEEESADPADMRDQPSSLFASSPHERIGGRAGKRKANQSDIMDDTLDGPKALKRSNKNSWRELEAYWSTQPVTSELQQGLIRRQVGWEEEEQLNSLKVIIAKAEEEAIAKMQAQVEELEMKLRDVLEKAKVTALEFKECYAGLMEDHDDLKNHVLLLYDEKKDLQAQLTTKQHVHDEEVADLEAKLEKYMTAYADDQETRCLALIRRAATFVPSGFEEIAQATFADCLERSKDKRKKKMPRPKAESWF